MRRNVLLILYLVCSSPILAQSKGGIEQYHYFGDRVAGVIIVPDVHFQTKKGWYAEARFNYDEKNTFSLLAGKTFSLKKNWSWSLTPMLGIALGELNGWTTGANFDIDAGKFSFNTQSQYTVSIDSNYNNFFFNWCELSYQPLDWLYGGISLQHTKVVASKAMLEPGFVLGITVKHLSFPLYTFNTFSRDRFFIVGVNWEWQHH